MIIVNIQIPVMGKSYDFQMDENVPLCDACEEIVDMICRRNQCELRGDEKECMLWDAERGAVLPMDKTPLVSGLQTGSRLILA